MFILAAWGGYNNYSYTESSYCADKNSESIIIYTYIPLFKILHKSTVKPDHACMAKIE